MPKMQTHVCPTFFSLLHNLCRISWLILRCENIANISCSSNINNCIAVVVFTTILFFFLLYI